MATIFSSVHSRSTFLHCPYQRLRKLRWRILICGTTIAARKVRSSELGSKLCFDYAIKKYIFGISAFSKTSTLIMSHDKYWLLGEWRPRLEPSSLWRRIAEAAHQNMIYQRTLFDHRLIIQLGVDSAFLSLLLETIIQFTISAFVNTNNFIKCK